MKIKDLTPLTEVYAHRRGKYGTVMKAVVLDTAMWSSYSYSSGRRITRDTTGARPSARGYSGTTGILVLLAPAATVDKNVLDVAGRLVLDEIAEDVNVVDNRFENELREHGIRIMVVLPTQLHASWADFQQREAADDAARREGWRLEAEAKAVQQTKRDRVNALAAQLDAPVKAGSWMAVAEVKLDDMIALLERLGRAEGKL